MAYCIKCGTRFEDENAMCCNHCGTSVRFCLYPMGWFKFLIYFSLWASAVLSIVNGFKYITGEIYSDGKVTAELVYRFFGDGLRVLDMVYGAIAIAMGAFAIYVRFRVAGFRQNGPACLYTYLGGVFVVELIYVIVGTAITGENLFVDSIATLVVHLVRIFVDWTYFNRRAALFNVP